MPIPLGVLAVAGAGGGVLAGGTYDLIQTTILGSNTSSVTFSNLNSTYGSTYQHLQIRYTTKADTGGSAGFFLEFNSDSGSNYAYHFMRGNGVDVTSTPGAPFTSILTGTVFSSTTANAFAAGIIDILDPFESTKNTTTRTLDGRGGGSWIALLSGVWLNTNSITTIRLFRDSNNFATGSRFSLYGLRSA